VNATRLALIPNRWRCCCYRVQEKEAELDEMWSFVQSKQQQRWLWQTVDHVTADVLAYVLDTHEDTAFLQLKALLAPLDSSILHGRLGAYERHLEERHTIPNVIPRRLSGNI